MQPERWWYTVPLRIRSLLRRRDVERELDEELRYHVDRQTEVYAAAGMDPQAARTAALRDLGGIEYRKEECRQTRGVQFLEDSLRDLRYALRSLGRSPGFTIVAVVTLALGIGANTAIFTVVNGVLLQPLPYPEPSRLAVLHYRRMNTVAGANFLDWKAENHTFARLGAAEYWTPVLTGGDRAEELTGIRVTVGLMDVFGVKPVLGRGFLPEEEHAGHANVALLRHELWQTRFGGDSSVVGRAIRIDGESYTVVGVMPPGYRFVPYWDSEAGIAAPLVLDNRLTDRTGASLRVFGRLAPGTTLAAARSELAAIGRRIERLYPGSNPDVTIDALSETVVGSVHDSLLILMAAVGLVLLIACANVAHLQLVRASAREREFAVRGAIGASGGRIIRQSLIESLILAAAGGLLGLLLGYGGIGVLTRIAPANLPRMDRLTPDWAVFGFLLIVTTVAGLMFGLAPALSASRVDVQTVLKEGGRSVSESPRRRRLRGGLVASQFAMAVVLLSAAALVLRSFVAMVALDAGYDPSHVTSMRISLRGTSHGVAPQRVAFFHTLIDRVREIPGVEAASAINHVPLHGDNWHFPFAIEGRPLAEPGKGPSALFRLVRPGYFATMHIPIIRGRDFTAQDEADRSHVVIIDDVMAATQWPGRNPIGERLTVDDPAGQPDWFTVIGVAARVRQENWSGPTGPEMYFPQLAEAAEEAGAPKLATFLNPVSMTLVVRSPRDAATLTREVERAVHDLDPDAPVADPITLQAAIGEQLAQPRFYMLLLGAFAGVALALAAIGVYGVISYSVARRRHEMGVRLALGAGRWDPFRLVVGQGMRLAAVGGAAGLVGALATTRYLRALLYGIEPNDVLTLGVVITALALVAFAACSIPAWRAARVDPATALRSD